MADKKKMSVEDILAACRGADAGAGGADAEPPASETESVDAPAAETPKAEAPSKPSGKAPGEMSVAEILAAARAGDSGGASADTSEEPAEAEEAPAAPASSGPAKKPSEMSVADILAAARGGGADKPAAKPKPKAKAAPGKAAAAKAGGKASPAKPAAKSSGPMDTSSILAAARKGAKPGPMSKAEAAAQGKAVKAAPAKKTAPPMPAKPDYAKPKAKTKEGAEDRRGFFAVFFGSFLAIGFTTFGLTNLLWTLGLARYLFPNILIEPPSQFKVGFPGDFAPGSVDTKFKAQFGIWVVNSEYNGQQQLVALKTVCTHLGCTPNWLEAEQKFKCPCHGSGFYKDGINFEGPAPRPLERYAIKVADDGQVEVDKSKTYQQEMGQWSDPACYVPV